MPFRSAKDVRSAKSKGRYAENAVADFLKVHDFPLAERRRQKGPRDQGDISGVPEAIISVKAEKRITLSEYMTAAEKQMIHAKASWFMAVIKRRGYKSAGRWYCVTEFQQMVRLFSMIYPFAARSKEARTWESVSQETSGDLPQS